MEPIKEVEIDGMTFQLKPLRGLKALSLDKKVITLLLPALKNIEDLDTDINIGAIISDIGDGLDKMSDTAYEKFLVDLFSTTIVVIPGEAPKELTAEVLNNSFTGKAAVVYELMFTVMKYNEFSPFALARKGGGAINTTGFSTLLKGTEEEKNEK